MWQKIELYIISLAFLFILIAINQIPMCCGEDCSFVGLNDVFLNWPPVLLFCLVGLTFATIFFFNFKYRIVKGATLPAEKITAIESLNYENLTFLATYIIPLVCFDLDFHLTEGKNFIMLISVLALIGWIYVKTNIFYTNPTLAVLNFKIYRISTESRQSIVVISKDTFKIGDLILPNKMDEQIFFASKYIKKNDTGSN